MKKAKQIFLVFLIFITSLVLQSCISTEKLEFTIEGPTDIKMGDFDFNDYKIKYVELDTEQEIVLEPSMIEGQEVLFYIEGSHTITINYRGGVQYLDIIVSRKEFENISLDSQTITYDGIAHSLEVTGDLPANATIYYPNGNFYTRVGTYTVTAIISCENYKTVTLNATLSIVASEVQDEE